jgi:hypothetical protein
VGYHLQGTLVPLLGFSAILAVLALWIPASADSGFFELGWRGAVCMAPLLFLGREVIRGMARPGAEAGI